MWKEWNENENYEQGAAPGCLPTGTRIKFKRSETTGRVARGWPERSLVEYSGYQPGTIEREWFNNDELLIEQR